MSVSQNFIVNHFLAKIAEKKFLLTRSILEISLIFVLDLHVVFLASKWPFFYMHVEKTIHSLQLRI